MPRQLTDMSRVLVTGGSGFIGTNLIQHLEENIPGISLINLDVAKPRNQDQFHTWVSGDILDLGALDRLVKETSPQVIYHLAARTDLHGRDLSDYAVNIAGVSNLLRVTNQRSPETRVIYSSSRMVCETGYQPSDPEDYCPPNLYGTSKAQGESLVRMNARHPWIIVRPTSIWGPWFGAPYQDFFDSLHRGLFFELGTRRS